MKFYQINIFSKQKNSIETFYAFLLKTLKTLNIKVKPFTKKQKKKVITILKSPHVNKKAQEQFQITHYRKSINCYAVNQLKFFTIFKTINLNTFEDIKIKIKIINNNKFIEKMKQKTFNVNNIKLSFFNKKKFKYNKNNLTNELKHFFNILDIYGEIGYFTLKKIEIV